MPTADRRDFVPRAVAQFLRQDYPERELLVLDDGDDRIEDILPDDRRVRYVALAGRMILGAKRNLACALSNGAIVAHWDDDDWMSDTRLSRQVAALVTTGADVCGVSRPILCDPERGLAWEYVYPAGARAWLAGNSLCYTKAFWRANPFPHVAEGEDALFLWTERRKEIHDLGDRTLVVTIVHSRNSSVKRTADPRYRPFPFHDLVRLTGDLSVRRPRPIAELRSA